MTTCARRAAVLAIALFSVGTLAAAQTTTASPTADDFFTGDVLHEIRLAINSKDWTRSAPTTLTTPTIPATSRGRA